MFAYERPLAVPEPERQHIRCTDCGNPLRREEMVQGRFPSYVRPRPGAPRRTFYAEEPSDPLCRRCWKEAVVELKVARA